MNDIVFAENIVMIGDIADRQGVSKAAVQGWMRREDFPAAVAEINAGAVYDYEQVRAWRKAWADRLRARAEEIA